MLSCCIFGALLVAQDTVREVRGSGWKQKFLTRDLTDTWKFEGRPGMWVTAVVKSNEFDPTLQLVRIVADEPEEVLVLEERDDAGSQSRITRRLSEAGKYELRVFAFERRGGGNYSLRVDRFQSRRLTLGLRAKIAVEEQPAVAFWFEAKRGDILTWNNRGPLYGCEFYSYDGRDLRRLSLWKQVLTIGKSGEFCVRLRGDPAVTSEFWIEAAARSRLVVDSSDRFRLAPKELRVFELKAKRRDFRLLQLFHQQPVHVRLVYLGPENYGLNGSGNTRAVTWLPVVSKGEYFHWGFVTRAAGRFQFLVKSNGPDATELEIKLQAREAAIAPGDDVEGQLEVGSAVFHSFTGRPGQRIEVGLSSNSFDPVLRLTNRDGAQVARDDNGGKALASRLRLLIPSAGTYRFQVSSVGNGGGGGYRLRFREVQVPEIAPGQTRTGKIVQGEKSYWRIRGKRGQELLFLTRSTVDTSLELFLPDGRRLQHDDNGGVGNNSLLAVRLPGDGVYTVGIGSRGTGSYRLRIIED